MLIKNLPEPWTLETRNLKIFSSYTWKEERTFLYPFLHTTSDRLVKACHRSYRYWCDDVRTFSNRVYREKWTTFSWNSREGQHLGSSSLVTYFPIFLLSLLFIFYFLNVLFQSVIDLTLLITHSTIFNWVLKEAKIVLFLLYFALWLVQKTRATLSTNQIQLKPNRTWSPVYSYVFIGPLDHFPFWLAVLISLALVYYP